MEIAYIADQIILALSGGRPTIEGLDRREVEALCVEALNIVGRQEYFENWKTMNQHTVQGQWLVNYQITLTEDTVLGYKQAVLPIAYINLPKNRGFVRARILGTMANSTLRRYNEKNQNDLITVDLEHYEAMKGSSLFHFSGKFYAAPVAGKIYILPGCKETIDFNYINITLAVASDATLTDAQGLLVIERVMPQVRLRMAMPADMVTDNNSKAK
jgi:hypothetical protein